MSNNPLNDLAIKYGTDKQLKPGGHGYTKYYYEQFKHLKDDSLILLEFGVHKGASLKMWSEFFKNGAIIGVDDGSSGDLLKDYPDHRNITFMERSQSNLLDLNYLTKITRYNIIIDDGSHYSQDIVKTFQTMFMSLAPQGIYVIEDLHCSYPPYTVGDLASRFNADNLTAVQYINKLVDAMHSTQFQNVELIESIIHYNGICFIKRT